MSKTITHKDPQTTYTVRLRPLLLQAITPDGKQGRILRVPFQQVTSYLRSSPFESSHGSEPEFPKQRLLNAFKGGSETDKNCIFDELSWGETSPRFVHRLQLRGQLPGRRRAATKIRLLLPTDSLASLSRLEQELAALFYSYAIPRCTKCGTTGETFSWEQLPVGNPSTILVGTIPLSMLADQSTNLSLRVFLELVGKERFLLDDHLFSRDTPSAEAGTFLDMSVSKLLDQKISVEVVFSSYAGGDQEEFLEVIEKLFEELNSWRLRSMNLFAVSRESRQAELLLAPYSGFRCPTCKRHLSSPSISVGQEFGNCLFAGTDRKEITSFSLFGRKLAEVLSLSFSGLEQWLQQFLESYAQESSFSSALRSLRYLILFGLGRMRPADSIYELSRVNRKKFELAVLNILGLDDSLILIDELFDIMPRAEVLSYVNALETEAGGSNAWLVATRRADLVTKSPESEVQKAEVGQGSSCSASDLKQSFRDCFHLPLPEGDGISDDSILIPQGAFTVLTGWSGSGQSSLLSEFAKELKNQFKRKLKLHHVDLLELKWQEAYTVADAGGLQDTLSHLFASSAKSRQLGFDVSTFSLRKSPFLCASCHGEGTRFFALAGSDGAVHICSECGGRGFESEVLQVDLDGKTIADCGKMTLLELCEFLKSLGQDYEHLDWVSLLGLEGLRVSALLASLTSYEVVRLVLLDYMQDVSSGRTAVLLLEYPSLGLVESEVKQLLFSLKKIVSLRNTVLCIENHPLAIQAADLELRIDYNTACQGAPVRELNYRLGKSIT